MDQISAQPQETRSGALIYWTYEYVFAKLVDALQHLPLEIGAPLQLHTKH